MSTQKRLQESCTWQEEGTRLSYSTLTLPHTCCVTSEGLSESCCCHTWLYNHLKDPWTWGCGANPAL